MIMITNGNRVILSELTMGKFYLVLMTLKTPKLIVNLKFGHVKIETLMVGKIFHIQALPGLRIF